jgi:hypothetical protein
MEETNKETNERPLPRPRNADEWGVPPLPDTAMLGYLVSDIAAKLMIVASRLSDWKHDGLPAREAIEVLIVTEDELRGTGRTIVTLAHAHCYPTVAQSDYKDLGYPDHDEAVDRALQGLPCVSGLAAPHVLSTAEQLRGMLDAINGITHSQKLHPSERIMECLVTLVVEAIQLCCDLLGWPPGPADDEDEQSNPKEEG